MSNDDTGTPTDRTVHVVVGQNQYGEDGFEVIAAFTTEEGADEFMASEELHDVERGGWEHYSAREVVYRDY